MQRFNHPHPNSLHFCEQLKTIINDEIRAQNGQLSFSRFMELCLYAPGLGYYVTQHEKFGPKGDFITAPELSPLFSYCLGKQITQIFSELAEPSILELGAGTGKMASDILLTLEKEQCLPQHYLILELSPYLKTRQQQTIRERCPQHLARVKWISELPPSEFCGVILANEVIDAMPVYRFAVLNNAIKEYFVTCNGENFEWILSKPSNDELLNTIINLRQNNFNEMTSYSSEINLFVKPWIKSLSQVLAKGAILIIDYGFAEHEYYHPERKMGTLMCHYQHRAHDDPLILPGLQDITAHVNFTQLASSAHENSLDILGYNTQAFFLLGCGIHEYALALKGKEQILAYQAIKQLTLPHEMGELFKVMALGRGIDERLIGFKTQDLRGRL